MTLSRDRVRHLASAAGRIVVILPLAVLLVSVILSPVTNWTVRTALAGFSILAVWRPDAALLVTTALLGFGIVLSHMAGVPTLRVTELLVVASLAGWCVHTFPRRSRVRPAASGWISVPIVLFAIAVVASAIVWQRVYEFESGAAASSYVRALLQFVGRDYFVAPGDFWDLVSTCVILEGLGLYVVVAAVSRLDSTFAERGIRMLIVGGAGLAVLSVVRLAEILFRNPSAVGALRATSVGLRISPQIPDYIAAGSYFALCWLAALGMAIALARQRLLWVAAGLPPIAGLYLTGSRSVIVALVPGLAVMAFVLVRQRSAALRRIFVFAVLALAVMVFSYRWMSGRDIAGEMARESLKVRVELIKAGVAVLATRPLFGVGLDRFFLLAGAVASPELRALWQGRMNPHNDFLRIGAELGLIGLALFLWILGGAALRIGTALRETRDPRLAGLAGGLIAFLVTSLVSNPLMVREVSYVFWIALGLAVGLSATLRPARDARAEAASRSSESPTRFRMAVAATVLIGSLLVLSIPSRAQQELLTISPRRVSDGLFDWSVEADGQRYRLSGPHATFFVEGTAQLVVIPLRGTMPSGDLQQVELRIDGRLVDRVAVGREWRRVRTRLPLAPTAGSRRIELIVTPSWVPADVVPGSDDRRALGVKVGEIDVVKVKREPR